MNGIVRYPPQDMGAEERVLGCLLIDPSEIEQTKKRLFRGDFYKELYGVYYEIILDMAKEKTPIDIATFASTAQGQKVPVAMHQLNRMVDVADMAAFHRDLATVLEKAALRKLANLGTVLVELTFEVDTGKKTFEELLSEITDCLEIVYELRGSGK
jgi:replicative DNA helicase